LEKQFPLLTSITTEAWGRVFERWTANFDASMPCSAAYLLDPSDRKHWDKMLPRDDRQKTTERICEFGVRYLLRRSGELKYSRILMQQGVSVPLAPPSEPVAAKMVALSTVLHVQLGRYLTKFAPFDESISPEVSARDYWFGKFVAVPELSTVAIAILSLASSEASVERSFGRQTLVHTPLRNSLGDENIEAEVFVQMNYGIVFPNDPIVVRRRERLQTSEEFD
jgi:hypothetical protein